MTTYCKILKILLEPKKGATTYGCCSPCEHYIKDPEPWCYYGRYDFTLSSHINDLCKKAFSFINSIGRKYLPLDSLKRLVNALVVSHLDYCNSLLYGLPSNELAKLQRVQNTAARLIV